MKILIIGGNRFVGLRLSLLLDKPENELHILNRTGQAPHAKHAVKHRGDRRYLAATGIDRDWDVVFDFACFTGEEANDAIGFFGDVKRYIFISTVSVYDSMSNAKETDQDPLLAKPVSENAYQEGKRKAEAIFHGQNRIPVVSVRLPFILGEDDYTQRLDFHVRCIEQGEPMYIADPKARVSMIHAHDAARFLEWSMKRDFTGPINVAPSQPIALQELVAQIEKTVGCEWVPGKKDENESPYGWESDLYMDVSKLKKLGFEARPIRDWLPGLIDDMSSPGSASEAH